MQEALLKAKHEQNRDITDIDNLIEIAESTNLRMTQFQDDLKNRQLLAQLAEDHTFAVEKLGIFGTPTLVFSGRQTIIMYARSTPRNWSSKRILSALEGVTSIDAQFCQ